MKMKLFLGLSGACAVGALFVACGSGSVIDTDTADETGLLQMTETDVSAYTDSCKADPA